MSTTTAPNRSGIGAPSDARTVSTSPMAAEMTRNDGSSVMPTRPTRTRGTVLATPVPDIAGLHITGRRAR